MDLGIAGKHALICGASKGLGFGCALALTREGVNVTLVARQPDGLQRAADAILQETGVAAIVVAADITTPAGREQALQACPQPDILVTNAGGPPPGDFRDWSQQDWQVAVNANMLTPIELIKATVDAMMARGFGRIVNITSSAVKAPIATLGLSNGARSGLTGFVAGLARQTVARGVTINNLLPGPFDTDRLASAMAFSAARSGESTAQVREAWQAANPAGRFGTIEEFGAACAFLCSRHAGFITGQNLLLDGGEYPGTL